MIQGGIYSSRTGRRNKWLLLGAGLLAASVPAIYFFNIIGFAAIVVLIVMPFYFSATYQKPVLNAYFLITYSFFLFAIGRYIIRGMIPGGILVDGIIALGYLTVWLSRKYNWANILDAPLIVLGVWLVYCITSLFNPESLGFDIWIGAVRVHLYMVLATPLFCLMLDIKLLKTLIVMWGIYSIILTIKGFSQLHIGLDFADRNFLEGNTLHMLWGHLRVFSFCSDAGQFGVQQAHAGAAGAILFLTTKNKKLRLLFLIMTVTGIYGMFVSGTRGAMFVLFGAAFAYCALIKKVKYLIIGIIFTGGFYCLMTYTSVGSSIYSIERMRTALNPEHDASYIVRKNNQLKIKKYLETRPFGGGLGAMMQGPERNVLADTPHDSGYVLIWGDQGIVGLCLYIGIFLIFLIKGTLLVWFKIKNEWLRSVLIAMISSIAGVSVANYGNEVMMQHPTSMMYFLTIAVIYASPRLDKLLQTNEEKVEQQPAPVSTRLSKYRVKQI